MPAWANSFTPFGASHALALAWTLGALGVSIWLGRRWQRLGHIGAERELAGAWGGFVVCVNLWNTVYWALPSNFDIRNSLPLHLCDLACLLAPLVFLSTWRWPRVLVYFWGLALSTQAFLTPTLTQGPADMRYWLFWLVHLGIVGSAVYDLSVRGFRPTGRDLGLAAGVSMLWLALVMGVNHALGANYGYVGQSSPDNPTLIDRLGPWPLRVAPLVAIGLGAMTLLWAVWPAWGWARGRGWARASNGRAR